MSTQEIIDKLDKMKLFGAADLIRQQQEQIDKLASVVALREMEIESLKAEREIMFGFVKSRGEIGQLIMYKASLEAQEK